MAVDCACATLPFIVAADAFALAFPGPRKPGVPGKPGRMAPVPPVAVALAFAGPPCVADVVAFASADPPRVAVF